MAKAIQENSGCIRIVTKSSKSSCSDIHILDIFLVNRKYLHKNNQRKKKNERKKEEKTTSILKVRHFPFSHDYISSSHSPENNR